MEFKGSCRSSTSGERCFPFLPPRRFGRHCFPNRPFRLAGSRRLQCPPSSSTGSPSAGPHYVTLLSVSDPDARRFYEIEAAENGWSVRELKRQLDSCLYQRLALSRDKHEVRRLAREGQVVEKASDLIKDPVVLEFLGLEGGHRPTPRAIWRPAIIDRLQQFLLELGKGFLFEARQKRFSFDDSHFFVDLVFYNRLLRCYVLIDLKYVVVHEMVHLVERGHNERFRGMLDRVMPGWRGRVEELNRGWLGEEGWGQVAPSRPS